MALSGQPMTILGKTRLYFFTSLSEDFLHFLELRGLNLTELFQNLCMLSLCHLMLFLTII